MGRAGGQDQVGSTAEYIEHAGAAWIREGCRWVSSRAALVNWDRSNMAQRMADSRLAPDRKARRRVRRCGSDRSFPARWPSSPTHGALLDVPPRLPHRQLGEPHATEGSDSRLIRIR